MSPLHPSPPERGQATNTSTKYSNPHDPRGHDACRLQFTPLAHPAAVVLVTGQHAIHQTGRRAAIRASISQISPTPPHRRPPRQGSEPDPVPLLWHAEPPATELDDARRQTTTLRSVRDDIHTRHFYPIPTASGRPASTIYHPTNQKDGHGIIFSTTSGAHYATGSTGKRIHQPHTLSTYYWYISTITRKRSTFDILWDSRKGPG